ncbi:transcriptional regulator [Aeromicrobium sp. PE09-221]|uniref:sigma-54-dependent Fis family transcriptional regulator n=1 Tax=Aeromicrobium sp. PE09-221 TaxID=1898043 RepID=UPI000B3EC306|nr:helix-turn-helix domain-containing protein [Aeromicrobium sp. PE09-221]OUZ12448.1 transcriptional regulator [Aeromicrobium sp. PE09-221]
MPNSESELLRIAAARADFLESGLAGASGVPDDLAASWVRSQAAGVDSTNPRTDFDQIDMASMLVRCSQPVLRQLGADVADMPLVIAVTDQRARVVQRVHTSNAVARLLDRVDFAPGYDYSEAQMGTNGVGTVLEAGRSVSVVGPAHFAENLQQFACTGAPIIDPLTGRVEGVLDISSLAQTWSPLMHTLAKSVAKNISQNLLLDRNQAQQAIFDTYLRANARATRQGVFAFGQSVAMANEVARGLFDGDAQQRICDHAMFLMRRRDRAADTLEMPDGRVVHFRGTRIVVGDEVAGVVVVVDPVIEHPPHADALLDEHVVTPAAAADTATSALAEGLPREQNPTARGTSPAWIRARAQLEAALGAGRPTLVMGESGTGKFTLVAEVFHACHPGARSISVDASQIEGDFLSHGLDIPRSAHGEPTLCIVRTIDQASTEGVEHLDRLFAAMRERDDSMSFVATLSDSSLDSDRPFHALLPHFDEAITVPPLRSRAEDLAAITDALLGRIAPARRVRLSPAAARLVARYSWPRNLTQLREALEHALHRRPVGEIQESDFPAYCQTTARHSLSPLESAERDAIVGALQEFRGNRVAAAAYLGMSRSTLYRKLKIYAIRM